MYLCVCVCVGRVGGGGWQSAVENDSCCYCFRSPHHHHHFHSKEAGAGVTAALNKAARHVGTATRRRRLRKRNISSSLNLPVDRFLLPSCFPLGSRAFYTIFLPCSPQKMHSASCFLSLFLCFSRIFGLICIFSLVFFHPAPPLPRSACLLPNEALRIKCLKDCRHFRQFWKTRHSTQLVEMQLRRLSDV